MNGHSIDAFLEMANEENGLSFEIGERQNIIRVLMDEPQALNAKIDPSKIIKWLEWINEFSLWFVKVFQDKNGKYRKPGFLQYARIVGYILIIGLKLLFQSKKTENED